MPQNRIFGPKLILPMQSRKVQVTVVQDMYIRRDQAQKHGEFSCSHATWNLCHTLCRTVAQCLQSPFHSLRITGPSQYPRVDKPHPASVACTLPAAAGCARKDVAQVVRNGSGVSNRYNCKFPHNTFDGDDVENR